MGNNKSKDITAPEKNAKSKVEEKNNVNETKETNKDAPLPVVETATTSETHDDSPGKDEKKDENKPKEDTEVHKVEKKDVDETTDDVKTNKDNSPSATETVAAPQNIEDSTKKNEVTEVPHDKDHDVKTGEEHAPKREKLPETPKNASESHDNIIENETHETNTVHDKTNKESETLAVNHDVTTSADDTHHAVTSE